MTFIVNLKKKHFLKKLKIVSWYLKNVRKTIKYKKCYFEQKVRRNDIKSLAYILRGQIEDLDRKTQDK